MTGRPDVLVASGTAPAVALAQAAAQVTGGGVPVVFVAVGAPIEIGLVESLGRPGRNVTGFASFTPELASKRLELLKESVPTVARPAVLWNPADADDRVELAALQAVAPRLGLQLRPLEVRSAAEAAPAVDAAVRDGADAVIQIYDFAATGINTAVRAGIPAISHRPAHATPYGALIAFGVSYPSMHRRAAVYVDKILRGAKASELPVEQPSTFELVVNLQTARALGLTIPESVLQQATEIIP